MTERKMRKRKTHEEVAAEAFAQGAKVKADEMRATVLAATRIHRAETDSICDILEQMVGGGMRMIDEEAESEFAEEESRKREADDDGDKEQDQNSL